MNEKQLAAKLRERQLAKSEEMIKNINKMDNSITLAAFRQNVASLNRCEIISSYLTCADCGSEFLSYHDAVEAANHSRTVEEWFSLMEHLRSSHLEIGVHQE